MKKQKVTKKVVKHHKQSKPGLFGKLSSFLKEVAEMPDEKLLEIKKKESEHSEKYAVERVSGEFYESDDDEKEVTVKKDEPKVEVNHNSRDAKAIERYLRQEDELKKKLEEDREVARSEVMGILGDATSKWKETGDVGVHLEAPKPLKEKVKVFWTKMSVTSASLSKRLKSEMDAVSKRVAAKLKKAQDAGQKVDADKVVREEWEEVLGKMKSVGSSSDRAEIEKIYKELEAKK